MQPGSEAELPPAAGAHAAPAPAMLPPYEMAASAVQGPTMADRLTVWKDEFIAWFKTLASAAVYATLIVTFGFQVARVEGLSMAPTLEDQDRLIVNKFIYRVSSPRKGDIVMLYYPVNPDKSFVKRVIGEEGDQVRIVDGKVFVNDVPMPDEFVIPEYRSHDEVRADRGARRLLLRDGRPPQQQLRQPPLGHGPEKVHHRPRPTALVADPDRARVLTSSNRTLSRPTRPW